MPANESRSRRMTRTAVPAAAALCLVAADAGFASGERLPDAELLAADTTAIITDPADPRLDAQRLRDGFAVDAEARERLQGGSVTLDGRLILIAGLEDVPLVERLMTEIGGNFDDATIRRGRREFVG